MPVSCCQVRLFCLLAILLSTPLWSQGILERPSGLPKYLTTIDGEVIATTDTKGWRVYCFLGVECPVSRFYAARLNELFVQFTNHNIQWLAIFSNLQDSPDDVRRFATDLDLKFPSVCDSDQSLAKAVQASRVPEVLVVDAQGKVQYRGRIDSQYSPGVKRPTTEEPYLENALSALTAGAEVELKMTEPVGCRITFASATGSEPTVTYCKDIAPLLNDHCLECHRPGEIGPFDVSDYREVRGWAEMILETIEQKRMPPWHADPTVGIFRNARHFPIEAEDQIRRWVQSGAPYGSEQYLPPRKQFATGWRLPRDPDLVVAMRDKPYVIPEDGSVDYQYFVVDPGLTEDKWVSAAQVIPGNASVVHHAIVFVRPPDGVILNGIGWLTAFVPGQRATTFPAGFARHVPAGSKLVFQMHYTPNGREERDITRIGLNFMDKADVTHQVVTYVGIDQEFEIPPGQSDHVVTGQFRNLPRKSGYALAIMPHMHLRGKGFELYASQGSQENDATCLLKIPNYDFNWQHTYEFAEPLDLAAIDRLSFKATFDNSTSNPFNPDPTQYVVWGDQTWEEMAVAFLEVALPLTAPAQPQQLPTVVDLKANGPAADSEQEAARIAAVVQRAKDFIAKYDQNRDGVVTSDEVNRIFRDYGFRRADQNNDQKITFEELVNRLRFDQRGR